MPPIAGAHMNGAKELVRRIEHIQAEVQTRKRRAGRAAANSLKVLMLQMAPVSATRGRDVARKKMKVRHLRSSVTVREDWSRGSDAFTVGPRSPLAHLVVRGTGPRHVQVGGSEGASAAHLEGLRLRRSIRQTVLANRMGQAGPRFGNASALAWGGTDGTVFANNSNPGPMPGNSFIARTLELGKGEARTIAGDVIFRGMPDMNEGA